MPINRSIGAIFELFVYLIVEVFFQVICFHVGYLLVRIITLGKNPEYPHDHEAVFSILGMLILLGPPLIYLLWIS
ncbi:MAG: hypothetical protein ACI9LU_000773 [Polaribacter sp.]|jgi:hypothetical protein